MLSDAFMKLADQERGIEIVHAYRDDVDHHLGGKDNTYWYIIRKNGKTTDAWIGVLKDGIWNDRYIKGAGSEKTESAIPSGTTVVRIAERAYLCQNQAWVTRKTPKPIEDQHPHYHYVYGFGDKSLDVSVKYGITMGYSELKDESAGFHLRNLITGDDVELPE